MTRIKSSKHCTAWRRETEVNRGKQTEVIRHSYTGREKQAERNRMRGTYEGKQGERDGIEYK